MTSKLTGDFDLAEISGKMNILNKASGLGLSGLDLGKYAGITALAKASGLGWAGLNIGKEVGISAFSAKTSGLSLAGLNFGKDTGIAALTAKASGLGLANLNLGKAAGIAALTNKTSRVGWAGLDIGKNSGIASLTAKASGLGLTGLDLGNYSGITALAAKASGLCLPGLLSGKNFGMAALAAKASSVGWASQDLGNITGIAALAANASTYKMNNPILMAAMRGIDIKTSKSLFALASKATAPNLLNQSTTVTTDLNGMQNILEGLLSSSSVEDAFDHLLGEKDFEETAIRLLSHDTNCDSITTDDVGIEPFHKDKNQAFGEWYDKLRPLHQQGISLLLSALITIFLGYFVNITTPYVDDFIHGRPHEIKSIVKNIKTLNGNPASIDSGYRFVSATRLHIREKARIDSAIIATATLGKVVKLEFKKQAWAKISYLDENNDLVCGWTLLRYITKFK